MLSFKLYNRKSWTGNNRENFKQKPSGMLETGSLEHATHLLVAPTLSCHWLSKELESKVWSKTKAIAMSTTATPILCVGDWNGGERGLAGRMHCLGQANVSKVLHTTVPFRGISSQTSKSYLQSLTPESWAIYIFFLHDISTQVLVIQRAEKEQHFIKKLEKKIPESQIKKKLLSVLWKWQLLAENT